jgi:hypothetical protein
MTADSFGFSVGFFDFSDMDAPNVRPMKTETFQSIGTLVNRIAARLKSIHQGEISAQRLGETSAAPGIRETNDADRRDGGETPCGFTELKYVSFGPRRLTCTAGLVLWEH